VTFEPGARTAWHTHPAGQTLIFTIGAGWVQEWGGEKVEVHAGDVERTPPDVKHWHGATATEGMTHIAIQEAVNGSAVAWLEHVSDKQYGGRLPEEENAMNDRRCRHIMLDEDFLVVRGAIPA
jgi:gentisate 1,2-dioxygenase